MRVNWLILSYNRPAPNQIVEVHIKYSENITFTLEVYDPICLVGTLRLQNSLINKQKNNDKRLVLSLVKRIKTR